MTRFSSYQVWDNVLPPYLALRSSSKGDEVGGRKHLAGIMHNRDPMRCALCTLGMNFAYLFFDLQIELPSVATWLDTMHKRPLIRLQCGRKAHTTEFNTLLHQDLELIGAKHSGFTLHGIRNQRIGEAHEDPNMRGDAIRNGVGHSTGSHFDSYKGCLETSYMLNSVGYRGTDPQMLASHVEVLLEYMYDRPEEAAALVDVLYATHREELLRLEEAVASDTSEGGRRVHEFLHYVRHCILSWVVSTVARPRTRLGLVDADRPQKRFLVASVYTRHLDCLVHTPVYRTLQQALIEREQHELQLGNLAQVGAEERRSALRNASHFDSLPQRIADRIQPQFASLSHDLQDACQLRLDSDYYHDLPANERDRFTVSLSPGRTPVGTKRLRDARLEHDRRKAEVRSSYTGSMRKWMTSAPPPTAGLAVAPSRAVAPSPSPPSVQWPVPDVLPPCLAHPSDLTFRSDSDRISLPDSPLPSPSLEVGPSPPAGGEIGTEAWRQLDERERHAQLESLLQTSSLTALDAGGVPQMLRNYLRRIAPLERLPAKRGYEWRGARYAGPFASKFSDLIQKVYEPVRSAPLCVCVSCPLASADDPRSVPRRSCAACSRSRTRARAPCGRRPPQWTRCVCPLEGGRRWSMSTVLPSLARASSGRPTWRDSRTTSSQAPFSPPSRRLGRRRALLRVPRLL